MNKNIRYVSYKDEAERSRLMEEYAMYGHYVIEKEGRILVSSKHPPKPTKKKGGRNGKNAGRGGSVSRSRD